MTSSPARFLLCATTALLASCGPPPAEGDANDVIVVAAPERWAQVGEDIRTAIEGRVSGVRDERVFTVVEVDPLTEGWQERARAPQVVALGSLTDPWVVEALESSPRRPDGPGLYQAEDVWAEGQIVNVLVVGEEGGHGDLEEHLAILYGQLHSGLRMFVRNRMFAAGANSELVDTLRARSGFAMLLPDSYSWTMVDSTYLFRSEDAESADDVRQVAVTWLSPPPPSLEVSDVLAWRARTARQYYGGPQEVGGRVTAERLAFAGYVALEIRGHWTGTAEGGERQEGSVLARVAVCEGQNRAYLLDSWLYSSDPETYPFVVELETILDTFRCE